MVFQNNILAGSGANQAAFQVARSLRFNSADSANLSRTFGTATTQNTYTFSCWLKRCKMSSIQSIFGTGANDRLRFDADNKLTVALGGSAIATSTALFRDCTSWYHIVYTQSGTSVTIYVNGTSVATGTGTSSVINTAVAHRIGAATTAEYFDGYMCEVYFIDGQALTPSNFAQTNGTTGVWSPKTYSGTYGANGFYLTFADNSYATSPTLGKDYSSNVDVFLSNSSFTATAPTGGTANNLKDNNPATVMTTTSTPVTNSVLGHYDCGSAQTVGDVRVVNYTQANAAAVSFKIQYSTNNTTWNDWGTYQTVSPGNVAAIYDITVASQSARYWRIIANQNHDAAVTIADFLLLTRSGNNFTPNNFSVTAGAGNDSLVDTPTNYGTDTGAGGEVRGNYCVYNQLDTQATSYGTEIYNNGSLDMPYQSDDAGRGTFGVNYGKWAFEVTLTSSVGGSIAIGWCTAQTDLNNFPANPAGFFYYYNGNKYISATSSSGSTSTAYGLSYTNGDVIRCEIDFTAKTIQWYKNNAGQGSVDISGALDGTTYYPCVYANNASSTINFGQRAFTNPASSGYKVLCTANLTAPTINKGSSYLNTILYTGTGASLAVTGLNFTPNFVWAKARTSATDHAWYDSVRGVQKQLESNTTTDETTETTGILSFDTNGFSTGTLAQLNTASITYASWNWLKSSTPGFDVVTYTGNGTNRTINHSVGAIPQMMFVKARSTAGADQNWAAYHSVVGNTKYLLLNSNAAQSAADSTYWNNTSPTASVFSVGTNAAVNTNNDTYVAYLWAPITGFSAFGKYTGNGSTDGPYICLGFRPALIIFKCYSTTGNWAIFDSVRNTLNTGSTAALFPNDTAVEVGNTTYALDLLSNGFKLRNSSAVVNGSGSTYVYAAFAENPFNYSRAR